MRSKQRNKIFVQVKKFVLTFDGMETITYTLKNGGQAHKRACSLNCKKACACVRVRACVRTCACVRAYACVRAGLF